MEALVLIDIQMDYFPGGRFPLHRMERVGKKAAGLLSRFRESKNLIIHIQHVGKEGSPFLVQGSQGGEIHPGLQPIEGEILIKKSYPNGFHQTDLHVLLQEQSIKKLHVAGAMTNMCVDSTVRAAFDLGYTVKLYKNCCGAPSFLGTNLIHTIYFRNLCSIFASPGNFEQPIGIAD